jgi:hypothetical protein
MFSSKKWNPTTDDTNFQKCTNFLLFQRHRCRYFKISTITVTTILCILIYQQQQNIIILAMSPNYSFRNAARIAPFGFPDSSRTIPTTTTTTTADPTNHVMISSRCSCGSVLVEFPYPKDNYTVSMTSPAHTSSLIDCHCPTCRRYHMAAFVRYLEIPANGVSVLGDSVVRYQDSCSELGLVQRIYCRRCSSKLLTRRSVDSSNSGSNNRRSMPPLSHQVSQPSTQSTVLVNMGAIDNQSVPKNIMEQWRDTNIHKWNPNMEASWARTTLFDLNADEDCDSIIFPKPPAIRVSGGCTCGKCQYEFDFKAPSEMQHCYCNLCRQLSGGMFMTWVPVNMKEHNFRWIDNGSVSIIKGSNHQLSSFPDANQPYVGVDGSHVPLVRYTDIGKRHMCSQCGSNLSILYDTFSYDAEDEDDEEERVIWLSAAGFDSIRFPFHVETYLSRLLHICCRFKPKWYLLPTDGIPRVKDAS